MIHLEINSLPAVLKDNLSFKLTSCNPYFANTSTFSYELELPMTAPQNRAIFGNISRRDCPKQSAELDAVLYDGTVKLMSGKAKVITVTDQAVKVQLLGHASAYNYDSDMNETYIDELEMGDWYNLLYGGAPYSQPQYGSAWLIALANRVYALDTLGLFYDGWINGQYDGYACVFYPVVNSTNSVTCNEFVFREKTPGSLDFRLEYPYSPPGDSSQHVGLPQVKVAPQPKLWFMSKLIAAATGYTLHDSDNALLSDGLLRRVFIANANIHVRADRCLPHWTVAEWWSNLEAAFGVVMVIDDSNKSLKLVKRADRYGLSAGNSVVIDDVLDEYSVDMDSDNAKETSSGNTGFADFDTSPWTRIPDELRSAVQLEHVEYATLADLAAAVADGSLEWDKSKIYIAGDGRHYVWDSNIPGIREVDQFGPRIVKESNSNIDVELKFIPCDIVDSTAKLCLKTYDGDKLYDDVLCTVPIRVLSRPDLDNFSWYESDDSLSPKPLDVGEQLALLDAGESSDRDDGKEDKVYIAIAPGFSDETAETMHYKYSGYHNISQYYNFEADLRYPRGWLHPGQWWNATTGVIDGNKETCGLNLRTVAGCPTLGGVVQEGGVTVDGAAKFCISFIADSVPDPTSLFIIHNKPYICEKLELTVKQQGVSKQITGYFYAMS